MKRSMMIRLIELEFQKRLGTHNFNTKDIADKVLNRIEKAGMLPPKSHEILCDGDHDYYKVPVDEVGSFEDAVDLMSDTEDYDSFNNSYEYYTTEDRSAYRNEWEPEDEE